MLPTPSDSGIPRTCRLRANSRQV